MAQDIDDRLCVRAGLRLRPGKETLEYQLVKYIDMDIHKRFFHNKSTSTIKGFNVFPAGTPGQSGSPEFCKIDGDWHLTAITTTMQYSNVPKPNVGRKSPQFIFTPNPNIKINPKRNSKPNINLK